MGFRLAVMSCQGERGHSVLSRTAEDRPHGEVGSEVLELMGDTGGCEQQIARSKRLPITLDPEESGTVEDDVELVLVVGGLIIGLVRCIYAGTERTVTEHLRISLIAGK